MKSEQKYLNNCILAVDIGGTLTKVALTCNKNMTPKFFSSISQDKFQSLEIMSQQQGKTDILHIYFVSFSRADRFFTFLEESALSNFQNLTIVATGGGALKFQGKFRQLQEKAQQKNKHFDFKVQMNEFETMISAIQLLIDTKAKIKLSKRQQTTDKLIVEGRKNKQIHQQKQSSVMLKVPLILVNLGSGISFLKLEFNKNNALEFTRIGGSSLGGGFLLGLQKLANQNFSFQTFIANHLTQDQTQIMKSCIKNVSQLISLYSDIHNVNTILITGGMAKADVIRNEFSQQLSTKNIFFTEIDGLLSVIGIIFSESKKNKIK